MTSRIYIVQDQEGGSTSLVKAKSPSSALRAVVQPRYSVRAANAAEAVELMQSGVVVIVAGEEADDGEGA
jgi:hypothetical protein